MMAQRMPGPVEWIISNLRSLWVTLRHLGRKPITIEYPEQVKAYPPRARGRIILSRDPEGNERCVACYLCSSVCPVDCIALQATEDEHGRRYPEWFRINFSRCIFCGFCEEACPTYAIQLTPDFEMVEYDRDTMLYEKEHLLTDDPGKYPDYDFYRQAGIEIGGKGKGEGPEEKPPEDWKGLLP
jgi:NADH-quinone oxidoreductase subunit I